MPNCQSVCESSDCKEMLFADSCNKSMESTTLSPNAIPSPNKSPQTSLKTRYDYLLRQRDLIIRLILYELRRENGSVDAIKRDKKLKDFKNAWVVKYLKIFRHFAVKDSNWKKRAGSGVVRWSYKSCSSGQSTSSKASFKQSNQGITGKTNNSTVK